MLVPESLDSAFSRLVGMRTKDNGTILYFSSIFVFSSSAYSRPWNEQKNIIFVDELSYDKSTFLDKSGLRKAGTTLAEIQL